MIEVLVVEDSDTKLAKIVSAIEGARLEVPVRIDVAQSGSDALTRISSRAYDLMLLDLFLPRRAGETPYVDGGKDVLRALSRHRQRYLQPAYIIGITAYDEAERSSSEEFAANLWYVVRYREESMEWEEPIITTLERLAARQPNRGGDYEFDVAVVTALHHVELEAVLALDGQWSHRAVPGDDAVYFEGVWSCDRVSRRVIAAAAPDMGMPAAASLSMKMAEVFKPRLLAMTGIAAGVKGSFGDILVADQSWDYGSGKIVRTALGTTVLLPGPSAIPMSPTLKSKLQAFSLRQDVIQSIAQAGRHFCPEEPLGLTVRIGPVASGAAVLEDRGRVREIASHNRKLIGVEMETFGVYTAAQQARAPRPLALSMKSICDFADAEKNDQWQRYAAFTSASYLHEFVLDKLCDPVFTAAH